MDEAKTKICTVTIIKLAQCLFLILKQSLQKLSIARVKDILEKLPIILLHTSK